VVFVMVSITVCILFLYLQHLGFNQYGPVSVIGSIRWNQSNDVVFAFLKMFSGNFDKMMIVSMLLMYQMFVFLLLKLFHYYR